MLWFCVGCWCVDCFEYFCFFVGGVGFVVVFGLGWLVVGFFCEMSIEMLLIVEKYDIYFV